MLNLIKKHKNQLIIFVLFAVVLDILIWGQILRFSRTDDLKIYFLNVGQGDSALVVLPGRVKVLIDAGPANGRVINELTKVMPFFDRYIDLVILSHPQLDHFGGLIDVLSRYQVGAFINNSQKADNAAYDYLQKVIKNNQIKTIELLAGDKIKYLNSSFDILSPTIDLLTKKELNDTSLVIDFLSNNSKTLFTGDIAANIEKKLLSGSLIDAVDILKVAHHGSKFSSSEDFLNKIRPKLAIIEVGKNSYGHPTKETIGRLNEAGAKIYRTDIYGTMKLVIKDGKIRIFKL